MAHLVHSNSAPHRDGKRALRRQVKQLEAKVQARREVRALERKLAALEVEHDLLKKAIRFNIERRRRSSSS